MKSGYDIVFEDDDIIVVNKTPQFLSVPDRYDPKIPNLFSSLIRKYGKIYPVHRLDRNTSGILCFAKHDAAFKELSIAFEKRIISKTYLAIVQGVPMQVEGEIDQPIARHDHKKKMRVNQKIGKASITRYKVKEAFRAHAALELQLITGRTHQIRVHLEWLGHPLLVDPSYGGKEQFLLSEIKSKYRGDRQTERALLTRTPLHAQQIVLPFKGEKRTYTAPLPKDMRATLKQLKKWTSVV